MGIGYNINSFTPFMPQQFGFCGFNPIWSNTPAKIETEEEKQERIKKEEAKKAAEEFAKRIEMIKKQAEQEQIEYMQAPLTETEKNYLKEASLKLEEDELKQNEGTLATSMLFSSPFLIPQIRSSINAKKNVVEMFYKHGGAHMDLFNKNPNLMINAQESLQKLEREFASDLKAAKGNSSLVSNITAERDVFRDLMQKALNSNNPQEIAKVTEQCNVAKGVKNGFFTRLYRKFRHQPQIIGRFDKVATAEIQGKFLSVKPPKTGTSFIKNICSSKSTWLVTAGMAIIPAVLDWGNIQKAQSIDDENKKNGKDTCYARDQIAQTGIKCLTSAITYNVVDTAARTLSKKFLGKLAAKFAAKIALKGGCKILGSAIGSVIPGIGTAAGLILGTVADYALNKYVFGNLEFFDNTSAKRAEVANANDQELLSNISEQYSMGSNIQNNEVLALLKRKLGDENYNAIEKMHNMSEDERNEYLAKLQEQQAQQNQQNPQTHPETNAA